MLVHLRLVVPTDLVADVLDALTDDDRLTNLTHVCGAALDPPGDLVEVDVAKEAAGDVLAALTDLGLAEAGGIELTEPAATPFAAAERVNRAAGGEADDGVIWDVVADHAQASAQPSVSFYAFLALATALAAVAVMTDSPIIVVGAMVVGPDFAPVAAACTGVALGRWRLAGRALGLLLRGYLIAVAVVVGLALLGRAAGLITVGALTGPRPMTGFIWHPDPWSLIVALLAGAAGALAVTGDKTSALVGVFISVTTVPAAGNLALALALGVGPEISGSLAQLGINVLGMLIAGVATVLLQRLLLTHSQQERVRARLRHRAALGAGRRPAPARPSS